MFRRSTFAALFLLVSSSSVLAQVADPILTDEPEQNLYEERKKKEIQKAVDDTKAEKAAYGGEQLLYVGAMYPIEWTLGASIGAAYGSYDLRNTQGGSRSFPASDYGPLEGKNLLLGLQAAYANVLSHYAIELNYRHISGKMSELDGLTPKGEDALEITRQRFTAEGYWTNIWNGFFVKGGYGIWGRSGTETSPKTAYSLFRAHGITAGLGYMMDLNESRSVTLRPMFSYDRALSYSEKSTATGTGPTHWAGQFDLRLRWRAWPKVMFELAPFARYEKTSWETGTASRNTRAPIEQDISIGLPISVVFSL